MNITKFAFRYNQLTWMILFLFVTSGVISFFYLGRNENAGFTIRLAQVITYMPGASPERVEELITDKIEMKIQEMPEIEYVTSESRSGISIINVKILDSYKDMDTIWTKLRRKVDNAIPDLPESASRPFVNDEFGDVYGMVIGLVWDGYTYAEVEKVVEDIRHELLYIPSISKVEIIGEKEERIYIEYRTSKLSELKIPPHHLVKTLKERNIINSGGVITSDTKRIPVEPSGNFDSVESLKKTLVSIPNTNRVIKLEDIANVYRGYQNPGKSALRVNGKDSIALAISMRDKGDIVALGKEVNALLDNKLKNIPLGIEYENIIFMPDIVKGKIDNFMKSLYEAIGIVCLVIFLFLGLRTGLIVTSLIPFSIITTFLAMSFLNIGLDQVSLPSLIVALGMLVDNGIVMCESIQVQMERGKAPIRAAIESANELRLSLLISSLTTSVSFLPIYLAESSTGEYTASIFKVVTITLLVSWIISSTIIPMICVSFLKVRKSQKDNLATHPIYIFYRNFLIFMLRKKFYSIGALFGIFVISIVAFEFVPKTFFPPSENPLLTAEIELPTGVSLTKTENTVKQIEEYIKADLMVDETRKEGVTGWGFFIGDGGVRFRLQYRPEAPNPNYAVALISVTGIEEVPKVIQKLETYVFNNLPDAKIKARPLQEGAPVKDKFELRIRGKTPDVLLAISDTVKQKLESYPRVKSTTDNWGGKIRKLAISIDDARAIQAGVTNKDVANSLHVALSGTDISDFRENAHLIPIEIRSVIGHNSDNLMSETFNVYSGSSGKSVPLLQVADINLDWEHAKVLRRNFEKTVTVSAQLKEGLLAINLAAELTPWLEEQAKNWPYGYSWEFGGEIYESKTANDSIKEKLPIALIIIIILLMIQFNCVKNTAIILLTIPMSIIGVVFGLLITDSYFGFMTLLGIVSLCGIVVNDAIVLLERIILEKEQVGQEIRDAVVVASMRRFRPIIVTTITTVAGLIPLWMYGGPMWEPMVIAIIFGLLAATVLTLGAVPILYSIFFRLNFKDYQWDSKCLYKEFASPIDSERLLNLIQRTISQKKPTSQV